MCVCVVLSVYVANNLHQLYLSAICDMDNKKTHTDHCIYLISIVTRTCCLGVTLFNYYLVAVLPLWFVVFFYFLSVRPSIWWEEDTKREGSGVREVYREGLGSNLYYAIVATGCCPLARFFCLFHVWISRVFVCVKRIVFF